MRYRLVKPDWAKESTPGPTIYEGSDFSFDYLKEKNEQGYNIYFFPNFNSQKPEGNFLIGKDISIFRQVFVDMDLKDGVYSSKLAFLEKIEAFPIKPNRVVDSGNGIHAYWNVADLTRESYVELQFRLINEFKTDASVWTVLQLMRLPGSMNTKNRENYKKSEILFENKGTILISDLRKALPPLSESQRSKLTNHLSRMDGTDTAIDVDIVDVDFLPNKFEVLLETDQEIKHLWEAEKGARSEADWNLAKLLLKKNRFSKEEIIQVILNTEKARSKGNYRKEYAIHTTQKVYETFTKHYIPPASEEYANYLGDTNKGERVVGPSYFDATTAGWRKGEVLGLVAGSGVGKTTLTLDIYYEMMKADENNEDIYVFFSLEMQGHEIYERWQNLIGEDKHLSNRLYIISNEDAEGNPRHINLQELYKYSEAAREGSGRNIGAIAIDHIGIVETTIDLKEKPSFGIMGEDIGFGSIRTIPFESLCAKLKMLAKMLNCFLIVQSQTTKEKAKGGDVELGLDAAFGTAKFEWYVDYIMTAWQPLRRVEADTPLRALGWQYCKIRSKKSTDKIKIYDKRVLFVDMDSGKLRPMEGYELDEFHIWESEAKKRRTASSKNESNEYKNSEGALKKLKALLNVEQENDEAELLKVEGKRA